MGTGVPVVMQPEIIMKLIEVLEAFTNDVKEHEGKYEDSFVMCFWLKDGTTIVISNPRELVDIMKEEISRLHKSH